MCAAQCYTVASADAKAPEFVLGGPAWVPHQTEERQPAMEKRWTVSHSTKAIQGRVETFRHSFDLSTLS